MTDLNVAKWLANNIHRQSNKCDYNLLFATRDPKHTFNSLNLIDHNFVFIKHLQFLPCACMLRCS